jgi:hypothetical protein
MVFLLELGGLQPGIAPSPRTMVTSVKILSLQVRFGVRNDVKMVPTFLKCFPNLESLHIMVLVIFCLHFYYKFLFI